MIRVYTERRLNQSIKFTLGVKSSLALILCHAIVLLVTIGRLKSSHIIMDGKCFSGSDRQNFMLDREGITMHAHSNIGTHALEMLL